MIRRLLNSICILTFVGFFSVLSHAQQNAVDSFSLYRVQVGIGGARTWTNCFGENAEMNLVEVCGGVIALESGGKVQGFPLVAFSDDDADYVKSVLKKLDKGFLFFGADAPDSDTSELRQDGQLWKVQIRAWAVEVNNFSKHEFKSASAWLQIRSVRDPNALAALEYQLENDRRLDVCLACLEAIGGIASKDETAIEIVVREAITNKKEEIRSAGALLLRQLPYSQKMIDELVKWSKTPYYQTALVNLHASGQMKKTKEIDPVIFQVLLGKITVKYKEKIPWYIWSGFAAGWASDGKPYGSFRLHREKTFKLVDREIANPLAYGMLKEYTKQDYGYDRAAWRKWMKSDAQFAVGK